MSLFPAAEAILKAEALEMGPHHSVKDIQLSPVTQRYKRLSWKHCAVCLNHNVEGIRISASACPTVEL